MKKTIVLAAVLLANTTTLAVEPVVRKRLARDEPPRRARVLGPVAKLRRARYTLSFLKELKAARADSTR